MQARRQICMPCESALFFFFLVHFSLKEEGVHYDIRVEKVGCRMKCQHDHKRRHEVPIVQRDAFTSLVQQRLFGKGNRWKETCQERIKKLIYLNLMTCHQSPILAFATFLTPVTQTGTSDAVKDHGRMAMSHARI